MNSRHNLYNYMNGNDGNESVAQVLLLCCFSQQPQGGSVTSLREIKFCLYTEYDVFLASISRHCCADDCKDLTGKWTSPTKTRCTVRLEIEVFPISESLKLSVLS